MNLKLILATILMSIFFSLIFEKNYVDYASAAKAHKARNDSRAIKFGIKEYINRYGDFNEKNSLSDLVLKNIIIKKTMTPWGNNYHFLIIDKSIIVYTPGKDGINDKNKNDDINYDVEIFNCKTHNVGCLKERIKPALILVVIFSLFLFPVTYIGSRIINRLKKYGSS